MKDEDVTVVVPSVNPRLTRDADLSMVERQMEDAIEALGRHRDLSARDDRSGRHLSLAITHIEDALLRVREVR